MLKILKGHDDFHKGIAICEESKNASSLPFVLHYISVLSEQSQKILLVSSKLTEMNYRLICSKAALRWNPNQIVFTQFIESSRSFDISPDELISNVCKFAEEKKPSSIIFDDLSILSHLGADPAQVTSFIHQLYEIMRSEHDSPLIFAPFSTNSRELAFLRNCCNTLIQISPVGHGFDKDASMKAIVTQKKTTSPPIRRGILLSGERTNNANWVPV